MRCSIKRVTKIPELVTHYSYTLFNNSLVRARPALSRKILARAILVLLLSAPKQRQARTRRGPKGF